ncbi:MAG: hypothetical protein WDA16_08515 [Candidatus Thermoplasmatota archaeon]
MTAIPFIDVALEALSLLLSLLLIVVVARLARRITRLSEPEFSTLLFLRATAIRRSLIFLAVAITIFVAIPMSDLAGRVIDRDTFEVIHDFAHFVFLGLVLGGTVLLLRMTPLPHKQTVPDEEAEVVHESSEELVKVIQSR